jgi:hypothetical protein
MYHYPLFEWPNYFNKNTFHLYGHVHGDREHVDEKAVDVSFNK